jgi:hypothetical protein
MSLGVSEAAERRTDAVLVSVRLGPRASVCVGI